MLKKISVFIAVTVVFLSSLHAYAHEDDYIVGLSAFRDGLYEISAPSLETYLSSDTEERKADYAHYLLYRMYLDAEKFEKSLNHLVALDDAEDRRFDRSRMGRDKMLLLTKTDCKAAGEFLWVVHNEESINYYLDSECKPDKDALDIIVKNIKSVQSKLKVVANFPDEVETVTAIFDSVDIKDLDDKSKKYFALYFYTHNDNERFDGIRAVYEDSEIIGIELDKLWKSENKEAFISGYEKYKTKYELTGANACRAFDIYKNSGENFDCNIVNDCMQQYSVEFVQVKGACLVKNGDKEKLTEFVNSLKPTIFPGMCGYGEYIFHKDMYKGKSHGKFYQCEQKYKIADILMNKKEYQAVVNMFYRKNMDKDRFYAASALRGLGKTDTADQVASYIKSDELKARYMGGTK